ncbi:hypothetical protein PGT21_025811 [Puccinia graminis f. sp. tritici]|uniref:Hydrophobin n=1 Tax=Puccinia graminis f. sp. tritici TaxID=56615 RepID=A0A5B0R668_PUCGR|nr:hypothetical protein PGT21_023726 [Puccinia graminis f. sp. tritici]KAA1114865.1 hypothetical protein PGT21_025811 [Puccinia graminis f. sp. tritici]KAA1121020.1 hypothetical protein PGTUg99_027364 [Puccinia graminis f. sp. tritici]KAA1127047.1 hypothetical protein PGTUg99_013343 [Puccinia graminis f. sp. tritici]
MNFTINMLSSSIILILSISRVLGQNPVFRKGTRDRTGYCINLIEYPVAYGVRPLTGGGYYPEFLRPASGVEGLFHCNEDYLPLCCHRVPPNIPMNLGNCVAAKLVK